MVTKAGKLSVISLSSISFNPFIINTRSSDLRNNAPVVAALGIMRNKGEKNNAKTNNKPVTKDVTPERPPSAIPAELSTKVVTVDVPQRIKAQIAL